MNFVLSSGLCSFQAYGLVFWFLIFFFQIFPGFMILMYIFETYLDLRQHAALKLPTLPRTLEGVISQEKFEKSRAYSLDKRFVFLFLLISLEVWMITPDYQTSSCIVYLFWPLLPCSISLFSATSILFMSALLY